LFCLDGQLIEKSSVCGCDELLLKHNESCVSCINDSDCNDRDSTTVDSCANPGESGARCAHSKLLKGKISVGVIEFVDNSTPIGHVKYIYLPDYDVYAVYTGNASAGYVLLRDYEYVSDILNNPSRYTQMEGYEGAVLRLRSLYYIPEWFEHYASYWRVNLQMDMEVFGPYSIQKIPNETLRQENCPGNISSYFEEGIAASKINATKFDAFVVAYITNDTLGRFVCKDGDNTVYAILRANQTDPTNEENIARVISAILHKFGASYNDGNYHACIDRGFNDVMYGYNNRTSVDNLGICDSTLEQIRWK
jgi:hypothetical protein